MTDERTTAYLLDELPQHEAEQFEEQCFSQPEWPEVELESAEEDLIQAYIKNELSPERRRRFEENYLTTAARDREGITCQIIPTGRVFVKSAETDMDAEGIRFFEVAGFRASVRAQIRHDPGDTWFGCDIAVVFISADTTANICKHQFGRFHMIIAAAVVQFRTSSCHSLKTR